MMNTLKIGDLSNNILSSGGKKFATLFSQNLSKLPYLSKLKLNNNALNSEQVISILKNLDKTPIERLYLQSNSIVPV